MSEVEYNDWKKWLAEINYRKRRCWRMEAPHLNQFAFAASYQEQGMGALYPLHRAAMVCDCPAIRRCVLDEGQDPNSKLIKILQGMNTSLHIAAIYGNLDACIELVMCGANPTILNKYGFTPGGAALFFKHSASARFLNGCERRWYFSC